MNLIDTKINPIQPIHPKSVNLTKAIMNLTGRPIRNNRSFIARTSTTRHRQAGPVMLNCRPRRKAGLACWWMVSLCNQSDSVEAKGQRTTQNRRRKPFSRLPLADCLLSVEYPELMRWTEKIPHEHRKYKSVLLRWKVAGCPDPGEWPDRDSCSRASYSYARTWLNRHRLESLTVFHSRSL